MEAGLFKIVLMKFWGNNTLDGRNEEEMKLKRQQLKTGPNIL